jgi:N-acetyl-anhydromuramyl-L-alanine amidase AmpD
MLEMEDVQILDDLDFKIKKKTTKKNQIFLYDTQRRFDDFLNKLKYRRNGKFSDIPHFVITKLGVVYQIFDPKYSSETFGDKKIDNKMIKIALENLGWLNKNTITGVLYNWIGDPYRSEPYIKNWRSHYFWDVYTEQQIDALSNLCTHLCEKYDIPKNIVPSQAFYEDTAKFKGVVCKSNYSNIYKDINPSFNFNLVFKNE